MVSRSQEGFSPDGVGVIVLVAQQGVLVTLTVGDAVVLIGLEVVGTGELHCSSEVDQPTVRHVVYIAPYVII